MSWLSSLVAMIMQFLIVSLCMIRFLTIFAQKIGRITVWIINLLIIPPFVSVRVVIIGLITSMILDIEKIWQIY